MILKIYSTETIRGGTVHADEKTFRKCVWLLVKEISRLELVSSLFITYVLFLFFKQVKFEDRLNSKSIQGSYISNDGTDFSIYEPSPFQQIWYSHKFKGPGIRYEVGVTIETQKLFGQTTPGHAARTVISGYLEMA